MSSLDDLAERIERLVLRHDELKRTNDLLLEQLAAVTHERESLKSRLSAARARVDALLDRLPAAATTGAAGAPGTTGSPAGDAEPDAGTAGTGSAGP